MKKKKGLIRFLIILGIVFIILKCNKILAFKTIESYMEKQGIDKSKIIVEDFMRDWTCGGYDYCVALSDEASDIYYEYSYYKGKVSFSVYQMPEYAIRQKIWGGNCDPNRFKSKYKELPEE